MKKLAFLLTALFVIGLTGSAWAGESDGDKGSSGKSGPSWFAPGPGYRDVPPGYRDFPPGYRDFPPGYRDFPPGYRDFPPGYRDFPPGHHPRPHPIMPPPPRYRDFPPRHGYPRPVMPPPPIYRGRRRGDTREFELLMQLMMMGIMIDQNKDREGYYDY